eukprot:1142783-Pelagomonas_calceolata.AAC.2
MQGVGSEGDCPYDKSSVSQLGLKDEIREHATGTSRVLAPAPKVTFPTSKTPSSCACTRNTDVDMPIIRQATTLTIRTFNII